MTDTVRRSNSIPRRRLQSTVLALAIVLLKALLATPTAQGQTLTVLHSFKGGGDGTNPLAGLIRDGKGSFYGTSQLGGAFNYGTVFKLDATGKYTLLYSFTGGADGGYPLRRRNPGCGRQPLRHLPCRRKRARLQQRVWLRHGV